MDRDEKFEHLFDDDDEFKTEKLVLDVTKGFASLTFELISVNCELEVFFGAD